MDYPFLNSSNEVDLKKFQEFLKAQKEELDRALSEDNQTIDSLTEIYRQYLGANGTINALSKLFGLVKISEKKDFGVLLNTARSYFSSSINTKKESLTSKSNSEYLNEPLEYLNFKKAKIGHVHPVTQTILEINSIFERIGYSVMDGPEIETDEYNFVRTNLPPDHPARDLQDSIFIKEPDILLRTQTSSIEARILEKYKPPLRVVMPGRTYRNEKVNKSNHFTFHQYQLVCIQEKVSLSELFATIEYLFTEFLGKDVEFRFRNKYYPEVEPGVGPDMKCFNCSGEGEISDRSCGVCKGRGWIEMGGAGIRHPNMLKMAGIDPSKWQGYAFGLGLDRWAMAKHNISDIRTLLGGNLSYLPNK